MCLLVAGNFALAQDKDDKALVAKPVEKYGKEKLGEKESSEKKKSDKKTEESDKERAEKSGSEGDGKKKEGMDRLSELFTKAWEPGVKLPSEEYSEFLKLLPLMLPGKYFLGDDLEWRLLFRDAEDSGNDMVTVNLSKKGSDPYARDMFFQLNYKTNFKEGTGNKDFEGYHPMALPGVHQMVLIGHLEIRAVAAADFYKSQGRIEDVLKAFPLKKIEKL